MRDVQPVQSFLDELASAAPAPGGGSAAALSGAMGAALLVMVCRLTIGKKKYADVEAQVQAILEKAEALRQKLNALMSEDTAAFNQVMEAYRLPKESEAEKASRAAGIEAALKEATRVPLETGRACAAVIALAEPLARIGNVNALSDAGVAGVCAAAGLKGAALNVLINLASLSEAGFINQAKAEVEGWSSSLVQADEVYRSVAGRMG